MNTKLKFLICISCLVPIIYFGYYSIDENKINIKKGFLASIFVFFLGSFVYTQRQIVNYPSSKVGVLLTRAGYVYIMLITFLYFQNEKFARGGFSIFGDNFGLKPLNKDSHTYEENCEFTWDEIKNNFDHYYLSHFFGWFIETLIFKDFWYSFLSSIIDELLELTFKYTLPHLGECWYDQIFHDLLFGNLFGIILGMWFIKFMKWETFDWFGMKGCKSIKEWKCFNNYFRFVFLNILTIVKCLQFLCTFFGMNALWIAPYNYISILRLVIWLILLYWVTREIYYRIKVDEGVIVEENNYKYEEAESRYLCITAIIIELGIVFKFSKNAGNFAKNPHIKTHSLILWLLYFSFVIIFSIYLNVKNRNIKKLKNN